VTRQEPTSHRYIGGQQVSYVDMRGGVLDYRVKQAKRDVRRAYIASALSVVVLVALGFLLLGMVTGCDKLPDGTTAREIVFDGRLVPRPFTKSTARQVQRNPHPVIEFEAP